MWWGSFITPYLIDEIDDEDGFDDSDEYFRMNAKLGTYTVAEERVPFTCTIPSEETISPPHDVALFGHGYDLLDLMGWVLHAFYPNGYAVCFNDFLHMAPPFTK